MKPESYEEIIVFCKKLGLPHDKVLKAIKDQLLPFDKRVQWKIERFRMYWIEYPYAFQIFNHRFGLQIGQMFENWKWSIADFNLQMEGNLRIGNQYVI